MAHRATQARGCRIGRGLLVLVTMSAVLAGCGRPYPGRWSPGLGDLNVLAWNMPMTEDENPFREPKDEATRRRELIAEMRRIAARLRVARVDVHRVATRLRTAKERGAVARHGIDPLGQRETVTKR